MGEATPIPIRVVAADGSERMLGTPDAPVQPAEEDGELAQLRKQNRLLRAKLHETLQDLQRLQGRHAGEVDEARREGQELAVRALRPAFSSIARALELLGDRDAELRTGLLMVGSALEQAALAAGFRRIADVDVRFDPRVHEAVAVEQADEVEEGTVLRSVAPGFVRADDESRVVTPARVVVARGGG